MIGLENVVAVVTGAAGGMGGGVVYLCSEAASFVTCSEFLMDGGFSQV